MDFQTASKDIKKVKTKTVLLFNSPFDLFKSNKHRLIISISMSGFVWFFLFTFGAFDFDYFSLPARLWYTATYSLSCLIILLADLFLLRDYLVKKTTMASAIVWGLWIMCCIALSNYMLTTLWFKWEEFSLYNLVKNQIYTLSIGLIITPFFILVNHIIILRKGINEVVKNSLKSNHLGTNQTSKELITINSQYKD